MPKKFVAGLLLAAAALAASAPAAIADDDAFFRMALATILKERLGFSAVHEAGSLDEALECLAERPGVGLALFDLAMPGMSGAACLGAVRECHPDVTVAVVSGSVDREDVLLALRAGVHGFVPKPEGIDALTRALGQIIGGGVYVPRFVADLPRRDAQPDEAAPGTVAEADLPSALPDPCLTPRQRQVLGLIVDGQSNKLIARSLGLGEGTVKIHVAAVLRALGVPNRSAAAVIGARIAAGA